MKKTFFYLVAFFLLCAFLSGCNASKASVAQVFEYDLGKGNILTESNQNIPYQMQGLIGVPDGENNPVVVILHGSHPIEKADKDRYDTGFSYLVEDLRQKGLLVLSINVGINYSFEAGEPIGNERTKQIVREHLDLLEEAVKGNNKLFSSDLSNKGDLNNIFLIGHSRAGLDVFEIANDTLPTRVSGIISVTPAFYKTLESKIPDIPTGIIISQYDGDVISLDGNDFYENILKSEKRSSDAELIYLKNANHGAFNTKLTQKDLSSTEEEIKKLMPAQNQRDFLTSYAADFIDQVLTKNSSVFSNEETLPTKVYGSDVLIRSTPGNSKMIISMDYPPNVKPQNAEIKQLIASFIPAKNTVDTFKMPGGSAFSEYGLLNILWQEKGAALTLPLYGTAL